MSANENCFALELNEKEVIALLENATPGSIKKATKYCLTLMLSSAFLAKADKISKNLGDFYHVTF